MPSTAVSFAPCFLTTFGGVNADCQLSTATGFVVRESPEDHFLVTNRHVVTGRRQVTGECIRKDALVPTQVTAHFTPQVGSASYSLELSLGDVEALMYDDPDGNRLWFEHPRFGASVDVVAIPFPTPPRAAVVPFEGPRWPPSAPLWPTTRLSVVGFPFGHRGSGNLAIWTAATIASEPDLDYEDLPSFLIDARTRGGQSGSPVLYYRSPEDPIVDRLGNMKWNGDPRLELVGVYSGRLRDDSDLGIVWKASVIQDIIDYAMGRSH